MKIIRTANELNAGSRKVCVAIGVFDGVHLGHQQVIRQAIADARQHEGISVAVTFDQHPSAVVAPERAPALIYPLSKKLETLASLGVDTALLLHFDQQLSVVPAEDFIRKLSADLRTLYSVSVGANFTFGHKRQGNVPLLQTLGQACGFAVHGLAAVALDGERVSSTRIRQAIAAGQLGAADQMLGRPYTLLGTVVEGDKIGRTIGFPTANLDTSGLLLPPSGVYAVHAEVAGSTYRAVLNIGHRPTLQHTTPQLRVEAHLLDFTGELYGKEMEISFVQKLREESRFPSLDHLKRQIAADITAAQRLF